MVCAESVNVGGEQVQVSQSNRGVRLHHLRDFFIREDASLARKSVG